jgi:hypothetical protein
MSERETLLLALAALDRLAAGEGWEESGGPAARKSVYKALYGGGQGEAQQPARDATRDAVRWFAGGIIP